MKISTALSYLILAFPILQGCSSDDHPAQQPNTAQSSSALPNQSTFKSPENDPNFVVATEIESQYGPNCIVRDVVVDETGKVWLASWQGIVMYNGKTFTNMTLQSGLSHHRIFSILEDSKSGIWFGSMGGGAFYFDRLSFHNFNTNMGLVSNTVMCIFEDDANNIWFGTDSGASCYDGKKFVNITASDSLIGGVNTISQDKNGVIWIGTSDGLFQIIDNKVTEVLTENGTHYSNVRDIHRDNDGVMWIGAARGLYKCVVSNDGTQQITSINTNFTSYISEDHQGNLLLTSDGIYRYDRTNFDTLVPNKNNIGIFGATEDTRGNVWYGAMDGLHMWDGERNHAYFR